MSQYKEISIDMIREPEKDLRTVVTEEGLQEMEQSVKEKGVLQPILVRQEGDKYEILAGWRRYTAAKHIGLYKVPCRIMDVDQTEGLFIGLSENLQREDMNHVDVAVQFARIANEQGLSPKQIAQKVGKTEEYVRQHLVLLNLEKPVLQALASGQINFTQARELCKTDSVNLRKMLFEQAAKFGANAQSLRIMRQNATRESREHLEELRRKAESTQPPPKVEFTDVCGICGQEHDGRQTEIVKFCPQCYMGLLEGLRKTGERSEKHMEDHGE